MMEDNAPPTRKRATAVAKYSGLDLTYIRVAYETIKLEFSNPKIPEAVSVLESGLVFPSWSVFAIVYLTPDLIEI